MKKILESLRKLWLAAARPATENRQPEQKEVLEIFEPTIQVYYFPYLTEFRYITDSEGYIIGENPFWKGLKNNK